MQLLVEDPENQVRGAMDCGFLSQAQHLPPHMLDSAAAVMGVWCVLTRDLNGDNGCRHQAFVARAYSSVDLEGCVLGDRQGARL